MRDISLEDILAFEEGFSKKPYIDTLGYPTIGYGLKIGPQGASLANYVFEMPEPIAKMYLHYEALEKLEELIKAKPIVNSLPSSVYKILGSMAYQLGVSGLLKFKNMWSALEKGDFEEAAKEALDSLWAKQTPNRANRHADVIRNRSLNIYHKYI